MQPFQRPPGPPCPPLQDSVSACPPLQAQRPSEATGEFRFPHVLYVLLQMGYPDPQARQMVSAQHERVARTVGAPPYLVVSGALPRCTLPPQERAAAEDICAEILTSHMERYGFTAGPMGTYIARGPQNSPQIALDAPAGPSLPGMVNGRYDPVAMERHLRDNPIDMTTTGPLLRQISASLQARRRAFPERYQGNMPPPPGGNGLGRGRGRGRGF